MKAPLLCLIAFATLAALVVLATIEIGAGALLAIIGALTPPSG